MRKAVRLTARGAASVAVLAIVWFLANLVYVWRTGEGDQARPVDAIVVMGAAQYDGRPSHQLAARLDHVVQLWGRGVAPMVITTGSKRSGDRFTEAHASAVYLEQHGVPANAIVEVGGTTSYDSITAAARLLQGGLNGNQLERVLLVSDAYHSLRIRLVAQERGLTAYVSPTRTSPVSGWSVVRLELKEAAGVSLGRLIGFDRLLHLTG